MKNICILILAVLLTGACCNQSTEKPAKKMLQHLVLFGFRDDLTGEQIKEIETEFAALPSKITEIKGFERGTDCSPENLQQGHTHCFLLSFESEKDRDIYLVHPAHKKFGELVAGKLKTVTVLDYWVK